MSITASHTARNNPQPSSRQKCVLKALAYFDIFQYPLTLEEIQAFTGELLTTEEIRESVRHLVAQHQVFQFQEYFSLHNNPLLAHRRNEGNQRAAALLKKAYRAGRFLYSFPYVRAVCISGSLSKNFADEEADIDFFIITRANRMWLARTLMHLFKKLTFLTGHQHCFCMNYFIDEDALLIPDQNIFTAVEIATLLTVEGSPVMNQFLETNQWYRDYLPAHPNKQIHSKPCSHPPVKGWVEWLFDNRVGDRIDQWLWRLTADRWNRKSEKGIRNKNGRTVRMLTGRHFSRSNPGSLQEKVLADFHQRLITFQLMD